MPTLTLKNISYHYKKSEKNVLDGVSCSFTSGQMAAVVGPSGSGKTTLLSILAGLDAPTDGSFTLDGQEVSGMDMDQWRRQEVSIIFQAFQLFPLLTVLENVSYPMELNGISKKEATAQSKLYLAMVGIGEEKYKRYPANLSGGEQQRVAIARSLASGARIILADEPTGNLDGENTENIITILKQLAHESGYCVIVVTHDLEIAEQSDAVWQMKDGKCFMKNPKKIYENLS